MLASSREMFKAAQANNFAIPAANFFDCLSAKVHVETAEEMNMPLILAYAEVHKCYLSMEEAANIGKFYAAKAKVPVVLHLDHGTSLAAAAQAVGLGFTSVMIDASQEVLARNIEITKEIVDFAHGNDVPVEAEIGHVGTGISDTDHSKYTSVEEAVELVNKTNLDSLAISIGTAHGTYKGKPVINFERLKELKEALSVPLVLHGGSSSGDDNLEKCATSGISKINIFTDFVLAAKAELAKGPSEGYFEDKKRAAEAIKNTLRHYYKVFHTQSV